MFNLLICEDEVIVRLGLSKLVRSFNLPIGDIYLAKDGTEALDIIKNKAVHIVFTDIEMPNINGLDMLRNIDNAVLQRVIITGHRNFDYAQAAIRLGIHDYILKPIDEEELRGVLTRRIEALESAFTAVYTQGAELIKGGDPITLAIEYIKSNYARNLTLSDVADKVSMNYSYFSSLFKKRMGISFSAYLHKVRVVRAKELLSLSDARVNEVAVQVGFDDEKYFSRVFKRIEGVSPGRYQLSCRKKG